MISWLGIIVYIWIHFPALDLRVGRGGSESARCALHARHRGRFSAWVADYMGWLLIEEFKVNLTVVAALLTVIGYSVNDTIVVFDRIREVRGKSPYLTHDMVNLSLNQTLSRTL